MIKIVEVLWDYMAIIYLKETKPEYEIYKKDLQKLLEFEKENKLVNQVPLTIFVEKEVKDESPEMIHKKEKELDKIGLKNHIKCKTLAYFGSSRFGQAVFGDEKTSNDIEYIKKILFPFFDWNNVNQKKYHSNFMDVRLLYTCKRYSIDYLLTYDKNFTDIKISEFNKYFKCNLKALTAKEIIKTFLSNSI